MCSLNSESKQTKYCSRPHYIASICGRYKNTTVLWRCKPTLKTETCTKHCDDHDNDGDNDGGDDDCMVSFPGDFVRDASESV